MESNCPSMGSNTRRMRRQQLVGLRPRTERYVDYPNLPPTTCDNKVSASKTFSVHWNSKFPHTALGLVTIDGIKYSGAFTHPPQGQNRSTACYKSVRTTPTLERPLVFSTLELTGTFYTIYGRDPNSIESRRWCIFESFDISRPRGYQARHHKGTVDRSAYTIIWASLYGSWKNPRAFQKSDRSPSAVSSAVFSLYISSYLKARRWDSLCSYPRNWVYRSRSNRNIYLQISSSR